MTDRAGLFPIICVLAMLLAPASGRAADAPAATAAIPPPPAPAATVHKATPRAAINMPPAVAKVITGSHAKARHATAATRKGARAAGRADAGRKPAVVAQRHLRHRATLRRPAVVRSAPPPPNLRRAYAGVPMLAPDGAPPPLPPPWYDRARPAIAFAYPPPFIGPRGPMPWWVR